VNKFWITFYDKNGEKLFRLKTEKCCTNWANDEADEMLGLCPEAMSYTINLAL